MTRDTLRQLHSICTEQLKAVREGAIERLEELELERRGLTEKLSGRDMVAHAAADPDGVGEELRQIMELDRLVRTALRGRIEERREALTQIDKRLDAERAYRRTSA
jgi:hypothetical protein